MNATHACSYSAPWGLIAIEVDQDGRLARIRLVPDAPPSGGRTARCARVLRQLDEYFAGKRHRFDLALAIAGTAFQRRVWRALAAIPYGTTQSYGDVARAIGQPGAARAVGNANGANRIPIVIPCHRVIASDGSLGGFGGGLGIKRVLLDLERARQAA